MIAVLFIFSPLIRPVVFAQTKAAGRATLIVSPQSETVTVGSNFDVSVFLDTQGASINTVDLNLKFPQDKLEIVRPSGGKSFIAIWPEPPSYSNAEGSAHFLGGIPNGITTEDGLVVTVTFKVKATGSAAIVVLPASKVFANDGLGTNILTGFGRGVYTLVPKPPGGVKVFSETHQFEDRWYNNNNPVLTWEKNDGVTGFSLQLDNLPSTIPDNVPDTRDTVKAYESLGDGVRYFHIKAMKDGVWGGTTHFALHVDTAPPAQFAPKIQTFSASVVSRAIVSFSTTDFLSGIDHYEVGVIDKTKDPSKSPAFVEAQSPYQLPTMSSGNLLVLVRAIDRAGNATDATVDAYLPLSFLSLITDNAMNILYALFFLAAMHYLFGHHIIARIRRLYALEKKEEAAEAGSLPADSGDRHESS